MVAIVSGSGLGLFNTSASTVGESGTLGSAVTGRGRDHAYINGATGNLVIQAVDEHLSGIGLDLTLVRTYNSQGLLDDDNADNWRLGVHQRLQGLTGAVNTAGSTITKVFGDGAAVVYTFDSALSCYVSSEGDGAHDTLAYDSGNSRWTWTDGSSRNTEVYDSSGRLDSTRDSAGNTRNYLYSGNLLVEINDGANPTQRTYFDYVGNNLAAIRVVFDGQTQTLTRYTYDSQNRLEQVRVDLTPGDNSIADGEVFLTTYTYEGTSNRIATISQGNGQTVGSTVAFTYELLNGQSRVKTYTDGEGRVTTYTYTQPSGSGSGPTQVTANTGVLSTTETQTITDTYHLSGGTPAGGTGTTGITTLVNGMPIRNLSLSKGAVAVYRIEVPSGASSLFIRTEGGTGGDADIFLSREAMATRDMHLRSSESGANDELIYIENPEPGTWYLAVDAWEAFEGVTLTTFVEATPFGTPVLVPGVQATDIFGVGPGELEKTFSFNVPAGTSSFRLALTGDNGDFDMYVRHGGPASQELHDYKSDGPDSNELIFVGNPAAGTWYVQLDPALHTTNASLVLHLNTGANTPPTVDAGAHQSVAIGADVTLTGAASDPEGSLTYQWTQVEGPSVTLDDATTLSASFAAPSVSAPTLLVFRLQATDSNGVSTSDIVRVLVGAPETAPSRTSWTNPVTLESSSTPVTQLLSGSDNYGNGVIVWQQGATLYARSYDPITKSWSAAVAVNGTSTAPSSVSLDVDFASGLAVLTWLDTTTREIRANRYLLNQGTSSYEWQGSELIATVAVGVTVSDLSGAINENGRAAVLWRETSGGTQTLRIRRRTASSWATAEIVATSTATLDMAQVVVTNEDVTQVVWRSSSGAGYRVSARGHSGSSWDSVRQINGGVAQVRQLRVDTDPWGDANVAWLEGNDARMNWGVLNAWNGAVDFPETHGEVASLALSSSIWSGTLLAWANADGRVYTSRSTSEGEIVDLIAIGVSPTELSVDLNEAGSAVVSWRDGDSVYAQRYVNGRWRGAERLEHASGTAAGAIAFIDDGGEQGVAIWRQNDGTADSLFFSRYEFGTTFAPPGAETPAGSWTSPIPLESSSTPLQSILAGAAVDGSTVTVWMQGNALYARRYDAATQVWTSAEIVGGSSAQPSGAQLHVDQTSGQAVLVWRDLATGQIHANRYLWSEPDQIYVWQGSEQVADISTSITVSDLTCAINEAGYAAVVWRETSGSTQTLHARHRGVSTWASTETLAMTSAGSLDSAQVAVSRTNQVQVVWRASVGADHVITGSTYSGSSWGSATELSDRADVSQLRMNTDGLGFSVNWVQAEDEIWWNGGSNGAWEGAAHVTSSPGAVASLSVSQWSTTDATAWTTTDGNVYVRHTREAGAQHLATGTSPSDIHVDASGEGSIVVSWRDGGNVYAARYIDGLWRGVQLLGTTSGAAGSVYAFVNDGTLANNQAFMVWSQDDGVADSVFFSRYEFANTSGGSAGYTVQAGDTWASIAEALYGTSAAAGELQSALGNPALTVGDQLAGLPASLTVTTSQTVTVPAYYVVPASATWTSVTQAIYGTSDANAVAALQAATGNPTLTTGLHLTVPPTLTYTTTGGGGITLYQQVDITDPLGRVTSFANDEEGRLVGVLSPTTDGARLERRYTYDAAGNITQITEDPDGLNRITTLEYDSRGNLTLTRDAAGNTITRTYSAGNQLLTETTYRVPDPDGAGSGQPSAPLTTRYAYDSEDLLRFIVSADGRVTEHRYGSNGLRLATLRYTDETYDLTGLAATTTLTEAQVATWAAARDLALIERADYAYDFRGNLSTVTAYATTNSAGVGQASGASITRYVYDQRGQLLSRINPRGEDTAAVPDDYVTTYTYDGLGRVLSATEWINAGASGTRTTSTQYHDGLNTTTVTLQNGLVTTSTFDKTGALLSVLNSGPGSTTLDTTSYTYDAAGRLRFVTDGTNVRQHVLYDEAGRKVATVDGDGTLTELIYDGTSHLIKTIVYADRLSAATVATLVSAGQPTGVTLATLRSSLDSVPERNPAQDRITRTVYDNAGRQVYAIDEVGAVTEFVYDGAGGLTDEVAYVTLLSIPRSTDQLLPSAVTVTTSVDDRRTRHFYDNAGNRIGILDAAGYLVELSYDAAGRLVRQTAYANATPSQHRLTGTLSDLRPAADNEVIEDPERDIVSYFFYDGQGRQVGVLDAEGYLTKSDYNADGLVSQRTRYDAPLTYSAGATLASLVNTVPGGSAQHTTSFLYDGAGRLVQETNYEGTVTQIDYDDINNLVSATRAQGTSEARTTQTRYDALGRVLAELTAEGAALIAGGMNQAQIDAIWNQYAVRYAYDLAGRRVSATDQNGYVTYFYYDADGRQTHLVNAKREVIETLYDARGRVTGTRRYNAVAAPGALTGGLVSSAFTSLLSADDALDARTTTTYAYLATGQEVTTTTAEGAAVTRRFDAFGDERQRLDQIDGSTQRSRLYTYDALGQLRSDALGSHVDTYDYDAFGRVKKITDQYNNIRTTEYDRLGRVIATVDPNGGRRATSYDAFDRVLSTTDALQRTTSYTYDDSSRSTVITTPEGISLTTMHNRHGQTLTVTDGRGGVTSYLYDENGQLEGASDGLGTLESRTYDRAGRQVTATDARGVVTTFGYDAANRVLTRTVDSASGGLALTTTYVYDNQGRVRDVTDSNGILTRTEYDRDGRVIAVIVDPGSVPHLNLRTEYQYDLTGNVLLVTEGVGSTNPRRVKYVYDALGRRIEEIVDPTGLGGTLNLRTQYKYDANDNVTRKIDAEGQSTWYVYDASDRLRYTIDALFGVTETKYDEAGRVAFTRRYATTVAPIAADVDRIAESGFMPPTASNADRREQRVYDRDGREVYRIEDVKGVSDNVALVTQKEYDANGNVIRTRVFAKAIPAGEVYETLAEVASALQGAGNDPSTLSAEDRVQSTAYDARDRAVFTVDGLGAVVRNEYDGNGNVIAVTKFATTNGSGAYDTAALTTWAVDNASHTQNRVTRTWYDGNNRAVFVLDAGSYLTEKRYDDLGREVTEIVYATAPSIAPGATLAQVISTATAIASASVDQSTRTEYDAAGRVHRVFGAEYTSALQNYQEFSYDAVGNKISFRNEKGSIWTYEYDANHRLIYERTPNVDVTTINGGASLTSNTAVSSIVTRFEYDALGNVRKRTEAYGTAQARTTEYQYDALGRQIRTIFPPVAVYAPPPNDEVRAGSAVVRVETVVTPVQEVAYDVFGNAFRSIEGTLDSGTGVVTAHAYSYKVYDKAGRVRYEVDAENYVTEYRYDTFGNQIGILRYATALTSALPTSGVGLAATDVAARISVSPSDRLIEQTFDRLNRVHSVVQPEVLAFVPNPGGPGGRTFPASPTTFFAYNAFGQVIRESRLVDKLDNAVVDPSVSPSQNAWVHDYFYYDNRGLKSARVDAGGYLTTYQYDETGDLSVQVEYAKALTSWNMTAHSAPSITTPATSPDDPLGYDREVRYVYDRLNRRTSTTRYNVEYTTISGVTTTPTVANLTTTFGYDVLGNQTRVTEPNGNTTYTYYDVLGRISAIVEPSRDVDGSGATTTLSPLTEMKRDVFGNLVEEIKYVNGATAANETSYTRGTPVAGANGDHISRFHLDSYGHAVQTQDSAGAQRYASYNILGDIAKEWQPVVDADGGLQVLVTIYQYDKLGQQTATIEPQTLGSTNFVVIRQSTYNAFGEIEMRGSNDGEQERFEYDAAGRVWRTNGADGVYRIYLYDLAGNATAEIRSKERDIAAASQVDAASWATQRIRTETVYDALGRVVSQRLPSFSTLTGPEPIDATFEIGSFLAPANPAAIYQRTMIDGVPRYTVNPSATLAQGGGYYIAADGSFVQDPNHALTSAVRIVWDAPSDVSVEATFLYRPVGSADAYSTLPIATIAGNKRAVNVHGLTDITYEYKVTYRRPTETTHYAEAGGTFRVDGSVSNSFSITQTTDPAANIAALPASFTNGLVTWAAPADTSVTATVSVSLDGSSWTDVTATRTGGSFQANVLSAISTAGTYAYKVVYRRDGVVVAQNIGEFTSTGAGNVRTATGDIVPWAPLAYLVPPIATLQGQVDGTVAATIVASEGYDPGNMPPPLPSPTKPGQNIVNLSWANIGATPIRVEVDYRSTSWMSWHFVEGSWELVPQEAGNSTSPLSQVFTSASTGVTFAWNSPGGGYPGIVSIHAVRVYAETSPGVWSVILSQSSPSAIYGRQISWTPPSSSNPVVTTFEWAPANTTNYSPLTVISSVDANAVSLNAFSPDTYQYRIRQFIGNRLIAERTGQFNVSPTAVTLTVAADAKYDIAEIPVTRVDAGLQWSLQPVPGAEVRMTYGVPGVTGQFGPFTLGDGPNYTFMFDGAPAGQRNIFYRLEYFAPGQTAPYAQAGGQLNVTITDTPIPTNASLLSQQAVYPSGLTTIAAPTGSADGALSWTTPGGPIAKFYYSIGSAAPLELTPVLNGSGYSVDTATLAAGVTYNYRIEYYATFPGDPYARGTGTFQITRNGIITSVNIYSDAPISQTTSVYAPTQFQSIDRWGNVIAFTDTATRTTNYRYNQSDQVIEVKSPEVDVTSTAGAVAQFRQRPIMRNYYDSQGRLIGTRDANDNLNSFAVNSAGQVLSELHADGGMKWYVYDVFGNQELAVDELGFRTWRSYDLADRLTSTTREVSNTTSIYDITESFAYDEAGRRKSETNGENETTRYFYDLNGNLSKRRTALGFETTYSYDAQGNKTSEVDAINGSMAWTYDYWGRVLTHTDLAAKVHTSEYDLNGQISRVHSAAAGQEINYAYDDAGNLRQIADTGTGVGRVTTYGYDAAGRRNREQVTVNGLLHQDTFTTFDELGRIKGLTDLRYGLTYRYDAQGNRTQIAATYYDHNQQAHLQDLWYAYDSMNRVVLSQGVNDGGLTINQSQGIIITYDAAGQRKSAHTYGRGVYVHDESEGFNHADQSYYYVLQQNLGNGFYTEKYEYDGIGRLREIKTSSLYRFTPYMQPTQESAGADVTLSTRTYDKASRQATETNLFDEQDLLVARLTNYIYDDDGRLTSQWTTAGTKMQSAVAYTYDNAAVLRSYTTTTYNASGTAIYNTLYTNQYWLGDSYQDAGQSALSTPIVGGTPVPQTGQVSRNYNANGELISITDTRDATKARYFVNNVNGQPITVIQGSFGDLNTAFENALTRPDNSHRTQHFFFANGQAVGSFGQLEKGGQFVAKFDVNYTPVSSEYPGNAPGTLIVQHGDTPATIAARVFGDPNLWYLIAEANGYTTPEQELEAGTLVTIPNEVVSLSNASRSFKPFDVAEAIGDTTPTQPAPPPPATRGKKGCGVLGQILVVVVAIVVTVYTAGAASGPLTAYTTGAGSAAAGTASGTWAAGTAVFAGSSGLSAGAAFTAAAVGGAVGSVASQAVGVAAGVQDGFSWKGVALGALGSGVTAGLAASSVFKGAVGALSGGNPYVATAINAAAGSAITQGVAVATGLRSSFSWREVAISAVSAPVASSIGGRVGGTVNSRFAGEVVSGISGSLMRATLGGKVDATSVLVDAFGNALGNSIVDKIGAPLPRLSASDYDEMYGELDASTSSVLAADAGAIGRDTGSTLAAYSGRLELDVQAAQSARLSARELNESLAASINANTRAPRFNLLIDEPAQVAATGSPYRWSFDPAYVGAGARQMAEQRSRTGLLGLTASEYERSLGSRELTSYRAWSTRQSDPLGAAMRESMETLRPLGEAGALAFASMLDAAYQPVGMALDLGELPVAAAHNLFSDEAYQLTGFSRLSQMAIAGERGEPIWREGLGASTLGSVGLGAYDLTTGLGYGSGDQALIGGVTLAGAFLPGRPVGRAAWEGSQAQRAAALRAQGFQEHHIISDKNPLTQNHELLELADFDLQSRTNKIFLPSNESLHSTRSIHMGSHSRSVSQNLADQMTTIVTYGRQQNWTTIEYERAIHELISEERQVLRSGERALNKNARPWSQ